MKYEESTAINFSTIKYLLDSEEAFFNNIINPPKKSIAMKIGNALHEKVLENKSVIGFTNKQTIFINKLYNAIVNSNCWKSLEHSNAIVEQEYYWEINGVKCKGKEDFSTNNILLDLKTINDIDYINNHVEKYKYKYQLAWYGMRNNFIRDKYILLFVDKTINNNVKSIIYSKDDLLIYADQLYNIIEKYKNIKHKIITNF